MARHRYWMLLGMSLIAVFGFASEAFADPGAWEAASATPIARVILGVASIAFTAALARGAAR